MTIDLNGHVLVEASAGTGKTYAIEQIVLKLLLEHGLPLDRILVVTFTEKATGELKVRLRKVIAEALSTRPDKEVLLRQALDRFDQAPISTIHAFCQGLLQEFPLEQ